MNALAGRTFVNLEAHRAANAARYYGDLVPDGRINRSALRDSLGRRHLRLGRQPSASAAYTYRNGYAVTLGLPRKRWAESAGPRSRYAHMPRWMFVVWDRGQVVLVDTRYLCGSNSTHAIMTDSPSRPHCPRCVLAEIGAEEAVRRLT